MEIITKKGIRARADGRGSQRDQICRNFGTGKISNVLGQLFESQFNIRQHFEPSL